MPARARYVRAHCPVERRAVRPAAFLTTGFDLAQAAEVSVHGAETVPCPDWIARRLGIAAGNPVHNIRRVLARR